MEYESRYQHISSETKARIEKEVGRVLSESYERCRKLLLDHRKELDLLAKALIQYETLNLNEVQQVIKGEKLTDRLPAPKGPMTFAVPTPEIQQPELPRPLPGDSSQAPSPAPPVPDKLQTKAQSESQARRQSGPARSSD